MVLVTRERAFGLTDVAAAVEGGTFESVICAQVMPEDSGQVAKLGRLARC